MVSVNCSNSFTLKVQILLIVFITTVCADFLPKSSHFRAPEYLPPEIPKCPQGYYGQYPNCHEPCPPYYIGYQPQCIRMKCLPGYAGEYQPDCVKVDCPPGEIGLYPNCVKPAPQKHYEVNVCPDGQIGTPPNCRERCPHFTSGEPPNCERIKCPDGWDGEYQPNCKLNPKCPDDKDGQWPNCVTRYCPAGSIGSYPNCKCRPGTVGTPPNCKKTVVRPPNVGYLPPNNGYLPPNIGYLPPNGNRYVPPYIQNGYLPPYQQLDIDQSLRSDFGLLPPNE